MLSKIQHSLKLFAKRSSVTAFMAAVVAMSNVGVVDTTQAAVPPAQVGSGFTVTAADLAYILQQIKIAEQHAATFTPANLCGTLVGPGPNQVASPELSLGLRTVDGSCNHLQPGQTKFGAADQPFPRLTAPNFERPAEARPANLTDFPPTPTGETTNFNQTSGFVYDSEPRTISNLVVDQTSTNPAAIQVAGFPVRTQGNPGVEPCTTEPTTIGGSDGLPPGCVPAHQTLFIPNVTTDVGLSPPFNSLFTIFGQFFDHGLDKITNGGFGQVVVPLRDDDPLICGNDHICNNGDDIPPNLRFMAITRGQQTGPERSAPNTDSPFVDQSQTYTSHASHQVFLREYLLDANNRPLPTGKFLSEPDPVGGLATWARIKAQVDLKLGIQLVDVDVTNIPEVLTDPYGNFIPGPVRGMPQLVTSAGLIEGNLADPVKVNCPAPGSGCPAVYVGNRIETAFLNDIGHSAAPGSIATPKTPDENTNAGGSLDPVANGEYDNELLDLHYICGDGRCNENIALTAIHQVFHMEHDRLAAEFDTATLPANLSLQASYNATNCPIGCATNNPLLATTFTYGQRLFQAARFVTEMQYQHLVFEEFARKVQPAINPFQPFAFTQAELNPAITAEFAHAVYRFGHSMLTDTIPRVNLNGFHNDIPLFDAFLNPAEFLDDGTAAPTASSATGAIVMGLSDQVGQEIDEFTAEAVRNRLLGLPQDLPAINMARARSEGVPPLNDVRRQIHDATNNTQMVPYTDWVNFGMNLKHVQSLVNFVAAYGRHPSIAGATALDPDGAGPILAGSLEARRMVADQLVNGTVLPGPDGFLGDNVDTVCNAPNDPEGCDESADDINPPPDSEDFMFSSGVWINDVNDKSITGIDDIDLWVGGLAEQTGLFGGLLGATFNYVFEKQLTDLQNGDRFYYLARTPGMNLRSQLEGNSFAELVMRNTPAHTLKADPFATADCKFELANLTFPAAAGSAITGAGSINDDLTTPCNENLLLIRFASDGSIRYRTSNTVDLPGINGQGVYNGGNSNNVIWGGVDNDTIWGGTGNDFIDGREGDDVVLGGLGDDIIIDKLGFDILKGGPGNDAIDAGPNDDIIMGGDGKDFTNGGGNINETFSGPGDDFAIAGEGEDAVFGDGGDDWEEGGDGPDLLIGDSSSLFFDDHNLPGHDVFIGQGGGDDYDMEGGDDIGVAGPGVEKVAGASGFDWEIALRDPAPNLNNPRAGQTMDLDLPLVGVPLPANALRDRFNEVEALSGWNLDDTLRGDSVIPSQVTGGGFIGCDALDAVGIARISGLNQIVTPLATVPTNPIIAGAVTNYCLLQPNSTAWGEGNILLGGAGSDTIEGRGADDIIDGDRYLNVRLSIRNGSDAASGEDTVTDGSGIEIASTDLMENPAISGGFGVGTTATTTLQAAVFARKVNPGNIVAVREILTAPATPADCGVAAPLNCDTAVFSGLRTEYTIVVNGDGSLTVTDNGSVPPALPRPNDGVDTLRNIEQLSFCTTFDNLGVCTARATVSVVPLAVASPTSVVFPNQIVGTSSAIVPVTVTNNGLKPLIISSVGVNPAGEFTVASTTCTAAPANTTGLVTGSSCTVNVRFTPTSAGPKLANVSIVHNGNGSPTLVPLSGTGVALVIPPPPASLTDNFNRPSTTTLGANWNQVVLLGAASIRVNANQASSVLLGSAYFATAGVADQAAGFTFANAPLNNTALFLKVTGGTATVPLNLIRVLYNPAGTGTVTIGTSTNAGITYATAGSASTSVPLAASNKLLAAVDNAGKVWVWKVVGSTTTLLTPTGVQLPNVLLWTTGGGRVGMQLPNGARVDDFVR